MSDTARLGAALADRYRIERELGQGGMAVVYLAEDVRHHRKVAVKVLHPELSAVLGTDRFLKEIELTAGLQHPHILPLFDSGTAGGLLYYVMPYVAGESLRARLAREKQLPVADALRIADEVAGALDYAHRHGVVHRDIKPENILLHDGRALVADFGIALAVQQAGGSRMTQTGMSLGTPQYMSPEQAMGEREITPRSDIYALGCITYEMLAGEPPFTGATAQAIVARVLTETPRPLQAQRHTIPEHVDRVVIQALEKLPADRFGSAAEFAAGLRDATAGGASVRHSSRSPVVTRSALPQVLLAPLGVMLLLTSGLAVWGWLRGPNGPVRPVVRYSLATPPAARLLDFAGPSVAVAPDGSRLAYPAGLQARANQLYLWGLDGGTPTPIAGTENATWPTFSPDGQSIAFLSGGQLRWAQVGGGGSTAIGEPMGLANFRGLTWTAKDEIVYATSGWVRRISIQGGPSRAIPLRETGTNPLHPDALPGGEAVVVTLFNRTTSELGVLRLETGEVIRLGQLGVGPRYVEPGFLVFTNSEGTLLAVPFDARRFRITGPPRTIAQPVLLSGFGLGKLGVSRNGTIAYLEGGAPTERGLMRVDRRGMNTPLPAPNRAYWGPRLSPDGRRIAVAIGPHPNTPIDIWVYDLELGTLSRVTTDSTATNPEWAADGRRILYRRAADSGTHVMAVPWDGSMPAETLYTTTFDLWEAIGTRSGDTLITRELRAASDDRDLLLVALRPSGRALPWAAGPRIQAEPALSPDGKWLAYSSEESGTWEVYVRAFPGPGPRYQISVGGGTSPRWNPRGGELFLLSADSLVAVPLRSSGAALEQGRGRALFAFRYLVSNFHAPYDVGPGGSWFVVVGSPDRQAAATIGLRIVLNWFDQPWQQ